MGFGSGAYGPSPLGGTAFAEEETGVPNPQYGHQLDADTLLLYKMGDFNRGVYSGAGVIVDADGHNPLSIAGTPVISWGPAKSQKRKIFSRWFDGSGDNLFSATLGSVNPLREHIVEGGGEYTLEVLARSDITSGFRGVINIAGSGETPATDFICRLAGTQSATSASFELFWERSGSNQQISIGGGPPAGKWWVMHAVFTDRLGDSSKWEVNLWLTVEGDVSATLLGTFDTDGSFAQGNGSKPLSTSGTSAILRIGTATSGDWKGAVGSVRFVDKAMSEAEANTAAQQLLSTGDVGDGLTSVGHWRLNETPDLIDETDYGFHMSSAWSTAYQPIDYPGRSVDLVGSGARARAASNNSSQQYWQMDRINFLAEYGREFYQYFNNDIDTVPSYTLAAWILYPVYNPGLRLLAQMGGSGESVATNFLFQFGMADGGVNSSFFAEYGSGVNISAPTIPLLGVTEPTDRYGKVHWAMRVRENPGSPGVAQITHFINGVSMGDSDMSAVPQGGSSALGVLFGAWEGWIQDIKVSRVARSDVEILADAQRTPFGG